MTTAELEAALGHILLVEDDVVVRRAFERILQHAGHRVTAVSSGAEGLERFRRGDVDVLLSDVTMPGMDGTELLRAIRAADADVPVLLMSGSPTLDSTTSAVELRAHRYLLKPIERETLLGAVAEALKLRRLAELKRQAAQLFGDPLLLLGDRVALEDRFTRALPGCHPAFQPIVSWSRRRVHGFEALLRSSDPSLPGPTQVLEAAERLGKIHELGRHLHHRIAAAAAALVPVEGHAPRVFVNLHPRELTDDALYDPEGPLARIASRVVLEITERAALEDTSDLRRRVGALRALGFQIAVDDLGAGYAGLNTFATLEPEVAKLDLSLIRDIHLHPTQRRLVAALAAACRDLGIQVVAEGIEQPEEREQLVELGLDLFQGYLFARPGPPFPAPKF